MEVTPLAADHDVDPRVRAAAMHTVVRMGPFDFIRNAQKELDNFVDDAMNQFDALDVDCSGALTPDELVPVVAELSEGQPWDIDEQHCLEFAAIFDKDARIAKTRNVSGATCFGMRSSQHEACRVVAVRIWLRIAIEMVSALRLDLSLDCNRDGVSPPS